MLGPRSGSSVVAGLLFGILLAASTSLPVRASLIAVDQNSNFFGNLKQTDTTACGPDGSVACGPTAAVNSFVFLQNKYPNIYGPSKLIPHTAGNTGYQDLIAVAETLADPKYMQCICDVPNKIFGTSISNFISGKMNYIDDQVGVGATVFPYQTVFNLDAGDTTAPNFTFLYQELLAGEDVELLLNFHDLIDYTDPNGDYYGGHYVTVTGLTLTDNDDNRRFDIGDQLSIDIIDPGTGLPAAFSAFLNGFGFDTDYGLGGSLGAIAGASIAAIVAESPVAVPEPASGLIMFFGLIGFGVARLRDMTRRSRSVHLAR